MDSDFEKILTEMKKPEVLSLKHEELLSKALIHSKRRAAVSFWWLIIPGYIVSAFLMWHYFHPGSSLISALQEAINKQGYVSFLIFVIVPLTVLIVNMIHAKVLFQLYRNENGLTLFNKMALHLLIVMISMIVITIYFIL